MLPVDVLQVVLLLLQLEDVTHKELLQVLVGKVDAELLKTTQSGETKKMSGWIKETLKGQSRWFTLYLLTIKFSKPKMSSNPIDLRMMFSTLDGGL